MYSTTDIGQKTEIVENPKETTENRKDGSSITTTEKKYTDGTTVLEKTTYIPKKEAQTSLSITINSLTGCIDGKHKLCSLPSIFN